MSNKGVEMSLTVTPIQGRDFNWDSRLSLSTNQNKLLSFGDPTITKQIPFEAYGSVQQHRVGYPLGGYWAPYPKRNPDGSLVLVNVVESVPTYLTIDLPVDFIDASVKDAEEKLAALGTKLAASAKQVVRVGSPAREIIDVAEKEAADLIIIASHRPDFSNYLIGATADRVVRHAKCSVLVDR